MSELDNIIDLTITRQTTAVSQAGFGSANFLSNDARFSDRIKTYSGTTEVTEDTLSGADTQAFAAQYFGQNPKPTILYVTKKMNDVAETWVLSFDADFVTSNTIDLKLNGTALTQTVFTTDQATTIALLATNIAADGDVTTATVTDVREITIVASANDLALLFTELVVAAGASQATGTFVATQYGDALGTDVESLTEADTVDSDWFALAAYTRVKADILALGVYMLGKKKIYGAVSNDADVKNKVTDNVLEQLKAFNYENVFLIYTENTGTYPEGAAFGKNLPKDPGSITWKFKTFTGIQADTFSSAVIKSVKDQNGNVYTTVGGQDIFQEGMMVNGEFIDIIRGAYWLHARIQENVYQHLVTVDKVPYTNGGVAQLTAKVDEILLLGVRREVLKADPAPAADSVDVRDQLTADKANRYYPDITFTGEFSGAIHSTKIDGTVSV